jgi:hypothetical protein
VPHADRGGGQVGNLDRAEQGVNVRGDHLVAEKRVRLDFGGLVVEPMVGSLGDGRNGLWVDVGTVTNLRDQPITKGDRFLLPFELGDPPFVGLGVTVVHNMPRRVKAPAFTVFAPLSFVKSQFSVEGHVLSSRSMALRETKKIADCDTQ